MGISWGLETRVLELFVIECLSCSLLPPQKKKASHNGISISKVRVLQEVNAIRPRLHLCSKFGRVLVSTRCIW